MTYHTTHRATKPVSFATCERCQSRHIFAGPHDRGVQVVCLDCGYTRILNARILPATDAEISIACNHVSLS